jgi:hypothetical protein
MSNVDNTFEILTDRKPTDQERQVLYKVRDALGIRNNDAMWQILVILEYYKTLYESIPKQIVDAADHLLKGVKQNADVIIKSSMETYKADFTRSATKIVQSIASKVVTKNLAKWSFFLLLLTAIILGTTVYFSYDKGYKNGLIIGNSAAYQFIKDDKYRVEWGNSAEGILAHEIAATGNLRKIHEMSKGESLDLVVKLYDQGLLPYIAFMYKNDNIMEHINCTGKGWTIKNNFCFPFSYNDENNTSKVQGWKIR